MDEHQLNDPAHTTAPGSDAASKTAQPEAAEESPQKSVLRRLWDSTFWCRWYQYFSCWA